MATPDNYRFVDKVPEDCICNICTNILTDPVQIECCGQLFCKECLKKWLGRQKACPHCRDTELKYIKDRRMKRIIDLTKVYCPNHSKGCDKISTVGECSTHLKTCSFVEVPCTNDCGARMIQKELLSHKTNKCPKRLTNCQHCKEQGMHKDIKIHIDKCPLLPLDCPNKCRHSKIQRKDLLDHQKKCPLEPMKCPFFEAGCKKEMPQKELAAHKASSTESHLELMMIDTKIKLQQISLNFSGLASCVTKQLATIESEPQKTPTAINHIKTTLEVMSTMLEQGKQYCLPLVVMSQEYAQSPSFYIQPGYKMHVTLRGLGQCTILLQKSEHDDKLPWPMPEMDIELTSMYNTLLHKVTTCPRCGYTVTRVQENQSEKEIQKLRYNKLLPPHKLIDPVLIQVKTHSCRVYTPNPKV